MHLQYISSSSFLCAWVFISGFPLSFSPITTIWQGGSLLASDPTAAASIDYVSRAEYQEYGSEALTRRWEGGEEADENGENDSQMTE